MKAAEQFGWSKTELTANIAANAYERIVLAIEEELFQIEKQEKEQTVFIIDKTFFTSVIQPYFRRFRKWWLIWRGRGRRWCFVCEIPICMRL